MTADRCPACGSTTRRRRNPVLPSDMQPFDLPPGAKPPACTHFWHTTRATDA